MPFKELNGICLQPDDDSVSVWRFITLAKFLDFALRGSLYFSHLAFAEDPYDGVPTGGLERLYLDLSGPRNLEAFRQSARVGVFVNCWHLSQHEPEAMWKLYAASDAGVALRTSYRSLRESFHKFPGDIHLGVVRYDAEEWHYSNGSTGHTLAPAMIKRAAFEHEKEVRAIYWPPDGRDFRGHHVEVDLSFLAPELVLSPAAPQWALPMIQDLLRHLGFAWPTRQSDLLRLAPLPDTWNSPRVTSTKSCVS